MQLVHHNAWVKLQPRNSYPRHILAQDHKFVEYSTPLIINVSLLNLRRWGHMEMSLSHPCRSVSLSHCGFPSSYMPDSPYHGHILVCNTIPICRSGDRPRDVGFICTGTRSKSTYPGHQDCSFLLVWVGTSLDLDLAPRRRIASAVLLSHFRSLTAFVGVMYQG